LVISVFKFHRLWTLITGPGPGFSGLMDSLDFLGLDLDFGFGLSGFLRIWIELQDFGLSGFLGFG
jgi:hypothetical protein